MKKIIKFSVKILFIAFIIIEILDISLLLLGFVFKSYIDVAVILRLILMMITFVLSFVFMCGCIIPYCLLNGISTDVIPQPFIDDILSDTKTLHRYRIYVIVPFFITLAGLIIIIIFNMCNVIPFEESLLFTAWIITTFNPLIIACDLLWSVWALKNLMKFD